MDSDILFLKLVYVLLFYHWVLMIYESLNGLIFKFSCALKSLLNAYKEKLKAKKEKASLQWKMYIYYENPLKH